MQSNLTMNGAACAAVILAFLAGGAASAGDIPRANQLRFDTRSGDWVELPGPVAGSDEGDLAIARAKFASQDYRSARSALKQWIKRYAAESPLYPQAVLLLGRSEKALDNHYVAWETLKPLTAEYAGTPEATEAALEMFNIAEIFLSGVRRKVWGIPMLRADGTALDILDDISVQYPETALAEQAVKTKADYHFNQGEFNLAELEYTRLQQSFPASRYVRFSMRRGADSALASFGGILFDDAPLIEAEERYRIYTQQYRGVAEQEQIGLILDNIRETRAAKELSIGEYYERSRHPAAAVFYYRSTRANWPETIAARKAADALSRLGEPLAAEAATPATTSDSGAAAASETAPDPADSAPPDDSEKEP